MLCNCRGPGSNCIMRHLQFIIYYQSTFWILSTSYSLDKLWIYLEGGGWGWGVYSKKSRSICSGFCWTSFHIKRKKTAEPPPNAYTTILEQPLLILHLPKSRWNPFSKSSSIQHSFRCCKSLWNNHNCNHYKQQQ